MDATTERIARCAGLAARGALGHRDGAAAVEETVVRTTLREQGVSEVEIEQYATERFGAGEHHRSPAELLELLGLGHQVAA